MEMIKRCPSDASPPQIFYHNEHIGGVQELEALVSVFVKILEKSN